MLSSIFWVLSIEFYTLVITILVDFVFNSTSTQYTSYHNDGSLRWHFGCDVWDLRLNFSFYLLSSVSLESVEISQLHFGHLINLTWRLGWRERGWVLWWVWKPPGAEERFKAEVFTLHSEMCDVEKDGCLLFFFVWSFSWCFPELWVEQPLEMWSGRGN